MGQPPIKAIVGLFTVTLLYLFCTLFLSMFIDAINISTLQSPDSFIDKWVSVWIVFGALLGIADFATVLSVISGIASEF